MTPPTDPARVAAIREVSEQLGDWTGDTVRFLLAQLDRAEAELTELKFKYADRLNRHTDAMRLTNHYRAQLATAREALENSCKCEYGQKSVGDWKVQMTVTKTCAACECLTRLDAQAEKPGAQGAPEPERGET